MLTKTPLASRYVRKLDDLNDQLCFAAFAAHELGHQIGPWVSTQPDSYTTDGFPANPHASRIHRRFADVPAFQDQAISQACSNSLQTGSEHVQAYFDEVRSLGGLLTGSAVNPQKDEAADDHLKRQLAAWGGRNCDRLFETAAYLRRRRNHLVHLRSEPTAEMRNFLGQGAKRLTAFWNARGANLLGFDFANPQLDRFRIEDGYAMMNLLRVCLSEIDSAVAAVFGVDEVLRHIGRQARVQSPRITSPKTLGRKIGTLARIDYGAAVTAAQAEACATELIEAKV